MPIKCSICQHPNAREIDDLLDAGEYKKDVALRFGVSAHALSRHGRGLCRADALDVEENKWAARLEKTYQQAVVDEDVRGQQQVATTALRHVRARKLERTKAAAEAASDAETDNRVSIGDLDHLVAVLTQAAPSAVDRAKIEIAMEKARAIMRPDGVQIFHRMWEDNDFAEALTDFAATWQPAQKGKPDESVQSQETRPN